MNTAHRPWPPEAKYLQIGDVSLDLRYRHVLRDGESIELQQRIFELLLLFIAEPHKLHTRAELFDRLWAGLIVDDANLSQNVWLLRKALGESRKQWVRTVAKGGYVFDPPGAVTWSDERPGAPPSVATPSANAPTVPEAHATNPEASPALQTPHEGASRETTAASDHGSESSSAMEATTAAPPPRASVAQRFTRHGWLRWAVAAALLVVVAVGLFVWRGGFNRPTPEKPLVVALIPLQDSADTLRWPARLLQDWLGWKLGTLPEVNLLSEADLAADTAGQSPVVVFLTSGRASGAEGQVVVRARVQGLGKETRLEETGPSAQVPAMVDRLSQRIIERLDSPRAKPWPALDISALAAQRYVQAVEAADRRDWMAVSAIGADVVRQAPRFGLMRLRLAQAQSRLVQVTAAKEQMEAARGLLQPISDDTKTLLDAQALAISPDRAAQAAKAFGMIAARYPSKPEYTLEHARLLVEAAQPKEALSLLQANLMQRSPVGLRIARHLVTASAAGAMGDPDLQRLHARAAENLARIAGRGWEMERAEALVAMGRADQFQYAERRDTKLFAEAARQFERAGNATGALHAQFLVETAAPPTSGPNPHLDTLLAKARAGGYRKLEIDILTDIARQHDRIGHLPGVRDWLEQAWAVAQDSGDTGSRNRLDTELTQMDIADLRLADADVRLKRLALADPEGAVGRRAYVLQAWLAFIRGQLAPALEAMSKSVGKLQAWSPGQPVSEAMARSGCDPIELQVLSGDLDGARKNLGLCQQSKHLYGKTVALIAAVWIEWAAGNRAEAERAMAQAQALPLPDGFQAWGAKLVRAQLLAKLGHPAESERLAQEVRTQLTAQSPRLFRASVAQRQAENATARGDWEAAKRYADEARRLLPSDAWLPLSDLHSVDIVRALADGDRARAIALASTFHRQARERGQTLVELEIHSLFPPGVMADDCSEAQRRSLTARTGMRGASLDWLVRGLRQDATRTPDIPARSTGKPATGESVVR